jgi:hypothetical protein
MFMSLEDTLIVRCNVPYLEHDKKDSDERRIEFVVSVGIVASASVQFLRSSLGTAYDQQIL